MRRTTSPLVPPVVSPAVLDPAAAEPAAELAADPGAELALPATVPAMSAPVSPVTQRMSMDRRPASTPPFDLFERTATTRAVPMWDAADVTPYDKDALQAQAVEQHARGHAAALR